MKAEPEGSAPKMDSIQIVSHICLIVLLDDPNDDPGPFPYWAKPRRVRI